MSRVYKSLLYFILILYFVFFHISYPYPYSIILSNIMDAHTYIRILLYDYVKSNTFFCSRYTYVK